MKYNLKSIMHAAWGIYRKHNTTFADALRIAWGNAKAVMQAKKTAEVTEETHTWYGWKSLGFEVIHESKALFQAVIVDLQTKTGTRKTSYFGSSQVAEVRA